MAADTNDGGSDLVVPVGERDHIRGPADAPVTIVEYGDFECPYCLKAFPLLKRLREEMDGRVRVVFRHFPLNSVHRHASVAAQAAESAGAQGKFWEMHDLLYEHQDELGEVDLGRLALKAGVELYKFQADLASERFARRVAEDRDGGERSGVKGTPSLFVNGRRYRGELAFDALKARVEESLSET